jgi:signal peptide peptidase SppA
MSRLLTAFYDTPWAIIPDRLPIIRAVLHRWADGVKLSPDEIKAAVGDAPEAAAVRREQPQPKGIGVIPILGIMAQRTAGDASSAGTATDSVRRVFASMLANSEIGAIVLDVDSPGGSVFGCQELAADIAAARGQKKVVAVANSLAASAAYWVASAAEEIVVTPSGQVGSIGVISAHEDHSAELEQKGVKVTLITAGKYKGEGHAFAPLSEEAIAARQAHVDTYYNAFVGSVAKNRGVKVSDVKEGFGQGRTVGSAEAKALGMVDRIDTFDATIQRLLASPRAQTPRNRSARADHELALLEAEHATH